MGCPFARRQQTAGILALESTYSFGCLRLTANGADLAAMIQAVMQEQPGKVAKRRHSDLCVGGIVCRSSGIRVHSGGYAHAEDRCQRPDAVFH